MKGNPPLTLNGSESVPTVGQKLYWEAATRFRVSQMVTVTAVGTKYLTLSNQEKVHKGTLRGVETNDRVTGNCYRDREARLRYLRTNAEWDNFTRLIRKLIVAPVGMTLEKISEARELLGLPRE